MLNVLLNRLSYIRFTPFNESTPDGVRAERVRLAGLSAIFSLASRVFALLLLLVATRVALPYLGPERFGAWMAISSIAMILGFLDFGIANALIGQVASASALRDARRLTHVISEGMCLLFFVGLAIAIIFGFLSLVIPLNLLFKGASSATLAEARHTIIVFAVLFGLSMPAQGVLRVYGGMQRAWVVHAFMSVLLLAASILFPFLPRLHAGMVEFLIVTFAAQQLGGLLFLPALVRRRLLSWRGLSWSWRGIVNSPVIASGGLFFVLQIGTAVLTGANQLIASSLIGPTAVAMLVLGQRMFLISSQVPNVVNAALWPLYADARARNDFGFIRATLFRSSAITAAFSLTVAIIIFAFSAPLSNALGGGVAFLPKELAFWIGAWAVTEAVGNSVAMYLNGLHIVRPQIVVVAVQVVIGLPIKIWVTYRYGLTGLTAAMVLLYVALSFIPMITVYRSTCFAFREREI